MLNIKSMVARCAILLLVSTTAHGSFQLESMGIILEESSGRASFNIKNTGNEPILLVSKLQDLDDRHFSKQVLISPPITRIDGHESQQVNFVLKKGAPLTHEILLKASFEGVMQSVENSARMPIRQEIAFLLQPSAVAATQSPWKELQVRLQNGQLILENRGKHVIRLAPQLSLLPGNKIISLPHYYLMAGEVRQLAINGALSKGVPSHVIPSAIKITPLSRSGSVLPEVSLPVNR